MRTPIWRTVLQARLHGAFRDVQLDARSHQGRHEAAIVGCAAIEIYANGALLRSVAVAPAARGRGVGRQLTEAAVALARSFEVPAVYLLTMTAGSYFRRFGFVQTTRDCVPTGVQQSVKFS